MRRRSAAESAAPLVRRESSFNEDAAVSRPSSSRKEAFASPSEAGSRGSSRAESREAATRRSAGPATRMGDEELIDMLRLKPKKVPELRTKSHFQAFFAGVSEERFRMLLQAAFTLPGVDEADVAAKVHRRLALMEGCLPNASANEHP
uniref:Uncharacterized protein n=1 Tax=Phaeomonas parva TaxID=124430 RepID=A0A7S1XPT3_9STRA|mmetsp:Transcript_22698/g.70297  ORF Transcript_22698/g.70297 Transcript_22698/m.70297 type:complete len:148 (+) Transcript_22698:191-634(+)